MNGCEGHARRMWQVWGFLAVAGGDACFRWEMLGDCAHRACILTDKRARVAPLPRTSHKSMQKALL